MNIKSLTDQQQEALKNALYQYDDIDLFDVDLKDEFADGIIPLAYTTYGGTEDNDYEIQINFNLNTMRYEEYINNELFISPNEVYDRSFNELITELNGSNFDDLIQVCINECANRYDIERKYENLNRVVGDEEYLRALWYLQKENSEIDSIFDSKNNYRKDIIDDYYKTHPEPDSNMWSEYVVSINNDIGGIQAFLDSLNKSKSGKDREKDNSKSKAPTK